MFALRDIRRAVENAIAEISTDDGERSSAAVAQRRRVVRQLDRAATIVVKLHEAAEVRNYPQSHAMRSFCCPQCREAVVPTCANCGLDPQRVESATPAPATKIDRLRAALREALGEIECLQEDAIKYSGNRADWCYCHQPPITEWCETTLSNIRGEYADVLGVASVDRVSTSALPAKCSCISGAHEGTCSREAQPDRPYCELCEREC
jgi:hypothetical protein